MLCYPIALRRGLSTHSHSYNDRLDLRCHSASYVSELLISFFPGCVYYNTVYVFIIQDGARVCQEFMARDPSEMHFTIVALCKAE